MARESKRVTLGGSQYIITQLGAVAGRGLFKKFVTAMGPLLRDAFSGPLLGEIKKEVAGLSEQSSTEDAILTMAPIVGPLLVRAVEDLPQSLFEEMCEAFSESCMVMAGSPATPQPLSNMFDDHFAGDYLAMSGWFVRCLMVNGFLAKLGATAKAPVASTTP